MKRALLPILLGTLLSGCSDRPHEPLAPGAAPRAGVVASASNVMINERSLTAYSVYVPCAADGVGEWVVLSGSLRTLVHSTLDGAGGFHLKLSSQPQGISGVGEITGDKYQATGGEQYQYFGKVGMVATLTNSVRIIGPRPDNNFILHQALHVTVNPNGTITADADNFTVQCE
jgi:hypothetical protein